MAGTAQNERGSRKARELPLFPKVGWASMCKFFHWTLMTAPKLIAKG